jgi:hypothetical protein
MKRRMSSQNWMMLSSSQYPVGTADADDASIHDAILGAAMMMALLPVLKFLHPTGMAVDRGQDLHQRDEIALGEVVLQGLGIAFFQRGGADRKAHLLEFDVRVFPVEDVSVRSEILPVQRRIKVREHLGRIEEGL